MAKPIHSAVFKALLKTDPAPQVIRKDGSIHATGDVFDGDGLVLLVGKGQQRSWEYRFRWAGAPATLGLGSAHKVGLAEARDARDVAKAMVNAKPPVDPRAAKAAAKAERLAEARKGPEPSFHDCAAKAVTNTAVCKITDPKHSVKWVKSLAPHLTANVTAKAPRDITREDVVTAIEAIRARGSLATANKVVKRFAAVFEWCAAHGLIHEDAPNPAVFKGRHQILLPPKDPAKAHHAMIPYRAAPAVMAGLQARHPRKTALCVEWIGLSAVRSANGTMALKADIDRAAKVWTIPASQMKEDGHGAHRVPLTDRHLAILDELATLPGANSSEFLFPSDLRDEGTICDATMRFTLREVYPHLIERKDGSKRKASIHGLRATFRTWAENQLTASGDRKYAEQTCELCLAHVVGDAARNAYVQENNVEIRRVIMNDWAAFLATGGVALAEAA